MRSKVSGDVFTVVFSFEYHLDTWKLVWKSWFLKFIFEIGKYFIRFVWGLCYRMRKITAQVGADVSNVVFTVKYPFECEFLIWKFATKTFLLKLKE